MDVITICMRIACRIFRNSLVQFRLYKNLLKGSLGIFP